MFSMKFKMETSEKNVQKKKKDKPLNPKDLAKLFTINS